MMGDIVVKQKDEGGVCAHLGTISAKRFDDALRTACDAFCAAALRPAAAAMLRTAKYLLLRKIVTVLPR